MFPRLLRVAVADSSAQDAAAVRVLPFGAGVAAVEALAAAQATAAAVVAAANRILRYEYIESDRKSTTRSKD